MAKLYLTGLEIDDVGRWHDAGQATFSDGKAFEFAIGEDIGVELFNSRGKVNSPKRSALIAAMLEGCRDRFAQRAIDKMVIKTIEANPCADEDTIREKVRYIINGNQHSGLVGKRAGGMLCRAMSRLYPLHSTPTPTPTPTTSLYVRTNPYTDRPHGPFSTYVEAERFAERQGLEKYTVEDGKGRQVNLSDFAPTLGNYVIVYCEYCGMRNCDCKPADAATLPNAQDRMAEILADEAALFYAPPKVEAAAPAQDCRSLLVEMARAMRALLGTCELNLDDVEAETVDTIDAADEILEVVTSYLANTSTEA